ncbi:oxidoreductase [Rosenbergiella epipactidis]|uniref:oxidoreductase n=1 Tax=Rosenbergiella epipactidis TaxID=1544694 RepID=UPI001BD9C2B2|nr:oxidoreductase [Rosenbergiella epipactidis]MBT0718973.1 oxidoreductase [Rosenbergiella epipactidis]
MQETSIAVGIIGFGFSGKHIHRPLIDAEPHLRLQAVCQRSLQENAQNSYRVETESQAIIEAEDIDLIVIATPNESHFSLAKAALLAGKHVVIDKPFTVTLEEAQQLVTLSQQQNRLLCAFQNRRWDADFLTVQQLIREKRLGELRYFESNYTFNRPTIEAGWREKAVSGGGAWYDLGAHLVDQMVMLFGQPEYGAVNLGFQRDHAKNVDFFQATYQYPHLQVSLQGSLLATSSPPRFRLQGTQGSYVKFGQDKQEEQLVKGMQPGHDDWGLDPELGVWFTGGENQVDKRPLPNLRGGYDAYYRSISSAIRLQTPSPIPLTQSLMTMQLIEQTPHLPKLLAATL